MIAFSIAPIQQSMFGRESTLDLKPRAGDTMSLKTGILAASKKRSGGDRICSKFRDCHATFGHLE